jgi:hypothetical protein
MSTIGANSIRSWRAMYAGILLALLIALTSCDVPAPTSPAATATAKPKQRPIKVRVINTNIDRAIARVLGTKQVSALDGDTLALESCSNSQYISVWAPGHYIKTIQCDGKSPTEYPVTLDPLNPVDNPNYAWVDGDLRSNSALNCATCHSDPAAGLNEYGEWDVDGHANVFVDPYFWTVYMGANTLQTAGSPDALSFRAAYPGETGRCIFCHAPAALPILQRGINWPTGNTPMPQARLNVETEGITCDVCHKVADVLIGDNGLPFADRPGVLSLTLQRPSSNDLFYFGPRPDHRPGLSQNSGGIAHMAACSSVFSESEFCAACHYGKFFDAVIYNSYGEWLESDYSKKQIDSAENKGYRTCQDCHMISSQLVGESAPAARGACSQTNQSFRDFSHNMMKRDNTRSPILIQGAATVTVDASKDEGKIKVKVTVVNKQAGHKLPTDSPLRHLILVVEARDTNGKLLVQLEGPTIPEWGGSSDEPGGYAGQPGVIYANILKDKVEDTVPAIDYWNPTIPAWKGSDTRLVPLKEERTAYSFVAPSRGEVVVTARLFYRYAFLDLILRNSWPLRDILVNWDYKSVSQ